ncbi:MAG TPA: MBL fold metallo-hydrolase [Dehalococcoidales bacterium]|nr:MBL fold metallo-hydrolase [Dehalococcoidales bacterium]
MEITWLGYSCFRLKGKSITVITDPCPPELGYTLDKMNAAVVTVSHNHPNHSYTQVVSGDPRIIYRPGEYEIGGVLIIGVPSYHDDEKGLTRGKNTIFAIEVDDVTILHLGDLGHPLSSTQIEELGNIDIMLVPVGGGDTISAQQAAAQVRSIEPKIVIPMHYKTLTLTRELDNVDKFLKEMGLTEAVPQPKLSVTKSQLPQTTSVVVLSA